ncbi:hypothetical protein HYU09_04880 [Candidatus Woesearchaeota archaeon]|nr:hypothetical protein [Candidatus Woesearchaeota archaeon]
MRYRLSGESKEHLIYITLMLILALFFLHNLVSASKIFSNIHHINDVWFISQNLKESLFEYGQLHLWTPYYYSGQPLYAQPEYYFLDLNFLYLLLFRSIIISMNLATITYFFLAGLGMYLLFLTFNSSKKAAFISAILYMFNGYMHSFVIGGNINVLAGYSLIPFAFMFFVKSLQMKDFAKYSILSGLFIALQLFAGGTLLIPYEIVLFGIYSVFYLIGKNPANRMMKLAAVGLIIGFVSFGLSAVKLLPGIEFMEMSNRSSGINYQEYLGHPIEISNIFHILVSNKFSTGISASIGIAGFILLVFSLAYYRKKHVLFSLAIIIFSIFMAKQGFVADVFYQLPLFSQLRHIERALFLIAIGSSLLAGFGFGVLSEKIKSFANTGKKNIVFGAIILFILLEVLFLQNYIPQSEIAKKPEDIPINAYMAKDNETFRTINMALSTLVGASGYNYLSQLGISEIKGGSGIWFNDYLAYLSIAQQSDPAKLWGILNNKYVISDRELSIPGLKFIDKFTECKDCDIWEAYGPYLYENLRFMPRAYLVDKAILVIGDQQDSSQLVYSLMLSNSFNPNDAVIIQAKKPLSGHSLSDLGKYYAIIITGSIDNSQIAKLRSYVDNSGILLPDIFNDKNSISSVEIENLFGSVNGTFEDIEIVDYQNNKVVYNAAGKKGFLVLSERFSNFPGWTASGKSDKEILKADGIITAVYVDNDDAITFKYLPDSFKRGLLITILAAFLIVAFLAYSYIKQRGGKNKS